MITDVKRYIKQPRIAKPVVPIEPTDVTRPLQQLQSQQQTESTAPRRSLIERKDYLLNLRKNKQTQTFLSDYNDPTELNSYIDALINREAVSKRFGEVWGTISTASGTVSVLAFAGSIIAAALAPFTGGASLAVAAPLAKVGAVAAIPSIPAAVDVTIEKGIKPIIAGKPKEALLNTLMNFGETMDMVANPVKGLILEGPEGFAKGTGLADGGRVNYDYDTGSTIADMLLEVVSDPLNWVDMGTSFGLRSATKSVGKQATTELVDNVVTAVNKTFAKELGEISIEGAERISKKVSKTAAQLSRDWSKASVKGMSDEAMQFMVKNGRTRLQQSLVQAIKAELPNVTSSQLDLILRRAGRSSVTGRFTKSAINQISDVGFDTLSTNVIKGLVGVQHYSDQFQKFMTKGAMMSSGYGLGVEAAKNGWKGIKAWANNYTLNKLSKAQVFDKAGGIDIKKFNEAKNIWEAAYKYTYEITGEASQRDITAFYAFAAQQFSRDQALISDIMQNSTDAIKRTAQLSTQTQALYGLDFNEYIGYIKKISAEHGNRYKTYVNYLEGVAGLNGMDGFTKPMGASIKTGKQLFHSQSPDAVRTLQGNIIAQVQDAIKTSKNKVELTNKFYTIKLNNAYVNSLLINDPIISDVLNEISSSEKVGALLDKIISAKDSLAPDVAPQIPIAVRTIKEAGKSFMNIKNLYNDIALLPLPKIKGISTDDFKRYIIDQIFRYGESKDTTVTALLASFNTSTLDALQNGLQTMLDDIGFKFSDYDGLRDQIASVYKRFLEAQEQAGIQNVGATIVQDFTQSLDDLVKYMPQFAQELQNLTVSSAQIRLILNSVRDTNFEWLQRIVGDKGTILNLFNTRQLTDAGLALKTVSLKENLDMFDLPANILEKGNIMESANRLGASINHLKKQFAQYNVYFTPERAELIDYAYKKFRKQFIDNIDKTIDEMPAFKFIKNTTDPIEQFAQLVEFNKIPKDKFTNMQFKSILAEILPREEYWNIINPSNLLVTDFAFEAMAQSAWLAEKQLNESLINGITAFNNLSLKSKKITGDFQAVRELLSANAIDRPKLLQQERYIKAASKINNMLEFFEKYYNSLFDNEIAKKQINSVREILINFPELNERYSELVDTLEAYWRGEISFRQDPKHLKNTTGYVDEFTPFYEQIKQMNVDIQSTLSDYNKTITDGTAFKYTNITPWDPVKKQQELNNAIRRATDINAKGALYNLFNLNAEEFIIELAHRRRFITFKTDDLQDYQLRRMFERFQNHIPENVKIINQDNRIWIVLDKSQKLEASGRQLYLNTKPITRFSKHQNFDEMQLIDKLITDKKNPGIAKTFKEFSDDIETLTGSAIGDSQGAFIDKDALMQIYRQMPEEVRKALPDPVEWLDDSFFKAYAFNESVLGTMASKAELGMYTSNLIINARNAIIQAQSYLKPKSEYVNAVFDSMLSISSENSVFKSFSDNDILLALQMNPDYHLVTTVYDKKWGMKTHEIIPTSVAQIKKAKELGAWIIPTQVYKDMYNTVNHRLGSSGFAKLWSRILYAYKFGYLCRPGAFIRNFIDTNLKSKLEMGEDYLEYSKRAHQIIEDTQGLTKYLKDIEAKNLAAAQDKYLPLAMELFKEKELANEFVQRRAKDGFIKKEAIKEYFKNTPTKYLTYEMYEQLNSDFLSQGISGNIMAELYKTDGGDAWTTFTDITGKLVEAGNTTENYNRLATYLYELDRGLDYTSALSKIDRIHFDYSFKSKPEQLAEMVFPFTTFSMRNSSYWVEMVEKYPWIMRNYAHLMSPSWDFKDYTPEELARDRRVQSQILYGQLKLKEFNDKVLLFKANPSIQDAIQMFSDPINNVYEKLAAPIATVRDLAQGEEPNMLNAIPIIGPALQSIQTMTKTGTPLPSAIGIQQKPKQTGKRIKFSNSNLSGTDKYTDNTYRTPKYRKNIVYDSYALRGVKRYRVNMYPLVDVAHDIKMRYSVNVYNRVKNRVKTDVFNGIKYQLRLDANRFK